VLKYVKQALFVINPKQLTPLLRFNLTPGVSAGRPLAITNWGSKWRGQFGPKKRGLFGRNFQWLEIPRALTTGFWLKLTS